MHPPGGFNLKILVAYYSLQGNTKCIGDAIAEKLGADVQELKPKEPIEASRFMDYYWSGKKNHPNREVELQRIEHDPRKYDLIFIGTPVWAWAPSPPVYSFLKRFRIRGKKIAIFITSEGERGKTYERLEKLLKGNEIISRSEYVNPLTDERGICSLRAREWANAIADEVISENE